MIKKYKQFINESRKHEFGCVMIDVHVKNWDEITSFIEPEDIFEGDGDDPKGIQKNPHVTLIYGLHDEVTLEQVKSVFNEFTDEINIEVDGIGIFENDKFDVVKFNVKPDGALLELYNRLSEFPNSNEYPDYIPHITLCYTKKGTGKKYIKDDYRYRVKNVNHITYSMVNGEKVYFEI